MAIELVRDDDDVPFHLRANRPRKGRDETPAPGRPATVDEAVEAMLRHRLDWREPTRRNCRHYLLGRRWRTFCRHTGIATIDQLTTAHVETFLAEQKALRVIAPKTQEGYRRYLRALGKFQATTPGYGSGLTDMARVPKPAGIPRTPPSAPCLSREEEGIVVARAATDRDRLILELLLATGIRVSELCSLLVSDLHLDSREGPAWIHVRGSIHDPDLTKSGEDRKAPLRDSYTRTVPARLRAHIAGRAYDDHVFISQRGLDARGRHAPLTTSGVEQICKRLTARVGFHVHPHLCRHTWATRNVDAGMPMFHLQQAGGWKSIEMVRRYYRADVRETLAAFERYKS